MAEKIFEYHPASIVSLNIKDFNGSIDLLYQLIVTNDEYGSTYDISTFPLHLVTNQFTFYLAQLDVLDMDIASDFIKIATTLLKMKSEALARVQIEEVEIEEPDTDESDLRKRLMVYQIVQENLWKLKSREKLYRINRKPKFTDADAIIVIDKFNMDALLDAFGQVILRIDEKDEAMRIKTIPKDKFPVSDQIKKLANIMMKKNKTGFYELFGEKPDKSEVISIFQALLRLMSKQVLLAEQVNENDIQIELNPELIGKDFDISEILGEVEEDGKSN